MPSPGPACPIPDQENNCKLYEDIQSLPPNLQEIIYKNNIAIKLRQRAALGWDKVHEHISKLPFCHDRQRIVSIIICFEYANCRFEGWCFPCYDRRNIHHKVSFSPPIELIPFLEKLNSYGPTIDYKPFLKICSCDGYDWHEWHDFYMNEVLS